jgi:hypothetical protein
LHAEKFRSSDERLRREERVRQPERISRLAREIEEA